MTGKAEAKIRAWAAAAGFDACGIAPASAIPGAAAALAAFVGEGRQGGMAWMAERMAERSALDGLWPGAKSAVVCALNYGPEADPLALATRRDCGAISVYARNRDYHEVLKGRLKQVAGKIAAGFGVEVKVFVDTAPVMEKPLAERAGLGWIGKHCNLVSRDFGSWLFLGVIAVGMELSPDGAHADRCGNCRRCLDACPTGALDGARRIDARRCVSYLTIEHKGPIPRDLRSLVGNRIYGCDDCLAACPWNRFAKAASEIKLRGRADLAEPVLADLAGLDDAGFRGRFSGSPVKRIGRGRFVRNVLVALGNGGAAGIGEVTARLADADPLVRGAAVWAASRLLAKDGFAALAAHMQERETDPQVRAEWADGRLRREEEGR